MKKTIVVVFFSIILTTLAVKAIDNPEFFLATVGRGGIKKEQGPCPQDMVFVLSEKGGFCIDKYENSVGANCPYQDPKSQAESRENLNFPDCKPVSVANAVPWRFISQDQAQLACAKAGKRLPTNEEWYLAALGTPDKSSDWTNDDCQTANNWSFQPGPTGSGKNCVSLVGAYDMIGNVWEWVSGTAIDGNFEGRQLPDKGYIDSTDGRGLPAITNSNAPNPNYNDDFFWTQKEGVKAFARGGYWDNKSLAGFYSVYLINPPSYAGPGTGFRCAK